MSKNRSEARQVVKLIYQLIRVIDSYSDVAIQLEHDADNCKNKIKSRLIMEVSCDAWAKVRVAQIILDRAPEYALIPIKEHQNARQYERYLGGEWLRERAPRVYWRHEKLFRRNYLEDAA